MSVLTTIVMILAAVVIWLLTEVRRLDGQCRHLVRWCTELHEKVVGPMPTIRPDEETPLFEIDLGMPDDLIIDDNEL